MIVAETDRLLISKFTSEDASFYLKLINTAHWIKYIGDFNIKTLDEAKRKLEEGYIKNYEKDGFGFYKLLLKEEDLNPIGCCGLIKRSYLEHVDIGFALLPEYESKGYGYESASEVIKLAKNHFNLEKITAITIPKNKSSIALIEKLGLIFEKKILSTEDSQELLLYSKDLE